MARGVVTMARVTAFVAATVLSSNVGGVIPDVVVLCHPGNFVTRSNLPWASF